MHLMPFPVAEGILSADSMSPIEIFVHSHQNCEIFPSVGDPYLHLQTRGARTTARAVYFVLQTWRGTMTPSCSAFAFLENKQIIPPAQTISSPGLSMPRTNCLHSDTNVTLCFNGEFVLRISESAFRKAKNHTSK